MPQQPQQVPQLSCLPSSSWLAAARRRVVGVVSLFFLILFFARLGLGGQEALLVEVASGVLEDPEVPAIPRKALPRAPLVLVVLLATTRIDAGSAVFSRAKDVREEGHRLLEVAGILLAPLGPEELLLRKLHCLLLRRHVALLALVLPLLLKGLESLLVVLVLLIPLVDFLDLLERLEIGELQLKI